MDKVRNAYRSLCQTLAGPSTPQQNNNDAAEARSAVPDLTTEACQDILNMFTSDPDKFYRQIAILQAGQTIAEKQAKLSQTQIAEAQKQASYL